MKNGLYRYFFCLLLCLLSSLAAAEIFTWTDDSGKVHFSDSAPETVEAESLQLEVNSVAFPDVKANPVGTLSPGNVVLYSTTWCGFCKKARNFFRKKGISFKEYDVEKTAKGRRDYARLGGGGVPIILVGEKRLNGFSADRFMSVYRNASQK